MANIVLLGAPGAGKGTQAALIKEKYNLPHISTGDIFRKNIREGTPLGVKVKAIIDRGELVPDELTVALVKDRLAQDDCKGGYILDGFPRTIAQAEALEGFSKVDMAINIAVENEAVIGRIAGRRMCKCGETYHISSYDKEDCAKCGAKLYQRDDDKEEVVRERLRVYDEQTKPLIDFYAKRNLLRTVDGSGGVQATFELVSRVIDGNN